MRLLMQQPFRKNKLKIYKNFSLLDFFVFLILAGIIFLIVAILPIPGLFRLLIGIPFLIPIIVLMLFNTKQDCRNYIVVLRWFRARSYLKLFIRKSDKNKNNKTKIAKQKKEVRYKTKGFSNDLVAIQSIIYDRYQTDIAIVKTKPLKTSIVGYWSAFQIQGIDITNYSIAEEDKAYAQLANVFRNIKCRISIIKISKFYDLTNNEEFLENQMNSLKEQKNVDQIQLQEIKNSYLESINEFKSNNWQNHYYIVVYEKNRDDLILKFNDIKTNFEAGKFSCRNLAKAELIQLQMELLYNQIDINLYDSMFEPIINSETNEIEQKGFNIDDFLAFDRIKFQKSLIKINDDLKMNIQSISKFPLSIHYHWLETLFDTPSSVVMHINPISWKEARSKIHKSSLNLKTNALEKNVNKLDEIDLENTQAALEELAEQVATGSELLKRFQIFFINTSTDIKTIEQMKKINETNASKLNAVINPLIFLQFEAFQNVMLKQTDNLGYYQEATDATIAGGWPFAKADFDDGNGFILGSALDGSLVIFDQFKLNMTRKNHNMIILGISGAGKSSFTKKIAIHHSWMNHQTIIIDPESEYKTLLKNFGGYFEGSYYALGGDSTTKFNPLQIQNHFSADAKDELKLSNTILILKHVEWFGRWIQILFPELIDSQIRYLESNLKSLYQTFYKSEFLNQTNITDLKPNEYPRISDLIKHIEEQKEESLRKEEILEIMQHHFSSGSLGFIYNDYSNVKLDDKLIIFDVQSFFSGDESNPVGRAALNIIISSINNQLILNYRKNLEDKKKIVLMIDEAHLLLDPDNPETIKFLSRTVKRIRKYNGGVILTTQNPGDFTDGADSKKLQGVLANIQYSFFLNMLSEDVQAVSKLYKASGGLTEYEQDRLASLPTGACLFSPMPRFRKFINFHYNDLEKQIAWTNYKKLSSESLQEWIEFQKADSHLAEPNILLPEPLKKLYLFFAKLFKKNQKIKETEKVKNQD